MRSRRGWSIAGGGSVGNCGGPATPCPNRVTDHFGTIGGGAGNQAGDDAGTLVDSTFATVGGGLLNTVNATAATVGGGVVNTASSGYATVGGGLVNRASAFAATVGAGDGNTASGEAATVGGGQANTASGGGSTVPGGLRAVAALHGQLAYAAGNFAANGDAQWAVYILRGSTTTATPGALFLDGNAALLTVPPGRALAFDGLVVARRDNGQTAGYRVQGVARNTGFVALVGAPTVTPLGDEASAGWSVAVGVASVNAALLLTVTGAASQFIRWVATVRTVEVVF